MSSLLDELFKGYKDLPPPEQEEIKKLALESTKELVWVPNPGPQTDAYFSKADVLLFGGSPGGGKSALEIGLAVNEHHRSLIIRKNFTDLEGLIDNAKKMLRTDVGFVGGSRPKYKKPNGGVVHFAGLSDDGGIGGHQGVDHDLICIDEAATVPEVQVRLLMGWLRTDRPGQRCRVVLASNPPLDSTGDWLIDYFGPWINEKHPNPAKPGELRYFLPGKDNKDIECDKDDFTVINDVKVRAQSRTYIPSKFTDNPFYNPEEYAKSLAGLPDAVRERLVTGNFMLARSDDEWQCIPTDWVRQAQARWKPIPPENVPMCAMAVDVAQGGEDKTVIAKRHDGWYMPLSSTPGSQTPSGAEVAGLVVAQRRDDAKVIIDMGGGYGGGALEHLKLNKIDVIGYKGAEGSTARTKDNQLGFHNKRSEAIWKFREALDPSQPGGSPIALPDDPEMVADLTAPKFKIDGRGIQVEPKEEVCKRLKRSTDKGDAVVMCWVDGIKAATHALKWAKRGQPPQVVLGYQNRRRR